MNIETCAMRDDEYRKPLTIGIVTIDGAFSGADAAIVRHLRQRGHGIVHASAGLSRFDLGVLAVRSFRLPISRWKNRWWGIQLKSSQAFTSRGRHAKRGMADRQVDCWLQVSGLFNALQYVGDVPKAIFCDYTAAMAARNYPIWFQLRDRAAARWLRAEAHLYRSADVIFSASVNTKRSFVADYGVQDQRVSVVGEGVEMLPAPMPRTGDSEIALFVGIDFGRKGGEIVLEGFRRVRSERPNAQLWIVGPKAREPIDGVTWFGHVSDRAQVNQLFNSADVFVMPSLCEPFGLAIIEAMSFGLPVVGSRRDAMSEIVVEGQTGLLIDPTDSRALADALTALLGDPVARRRMGESGRDLVAKQFLWSQVVERIESELYRIVWSR